MSPIYTIDFQAMASRCEIRLAAASGAEARALADPALEEVRRIEAKYSRYRADSIVSRINAAAGISAVDCDDETLALLDYADAVYRSSGGRFDITSGVLRKVWDFRMGTAPSPRSLERLLPLVGWPQVRREGGSVMLSHAGMELDFGGFGKEYAVDRAAEILTAQGVQHGYVNLGGDMRFLGPRPDGGEWSIGIQHPRDTQATVASVPFSRGALATSGDYERYFEADGRRYCHILDPRNGMPVSYWRSVSVVSPMAIAAGSCSTTAMLLERDGLDFLEQSGLSFLAIDQEGRIFRR
ncbi:FAD:protein FMN transferase [Duganella sp. Root1480D1]|uniref:FAD:protein FMN transferase n=1 Tax=Duganella sp. Root1480D1 TaxID=1736471 RepID=UPI001E29C821|nr:FAD:protein FMN transferase [Duganella sp. Root1480D1]